jgi:hypothetical protein
MKGYITNVKISEDKTNIIFILDIKKDDTTLYKTMNCLFQTKDYSIDKVNEMINSLLQTASQEEPIVSTFTKTEQEILAELPAEYSI